VGRGLDAALEGCLSRARHKSLQASPFYLKMGFKKLGEASCRLSGDVVLEAIKMEKSLRE
jgi:hypothetical protein